MGLSKDRLIFDPTDAASIAASDQVGSFIFGAGGTLVTSTDAGGGVEALDVNIADGITLEVALDGFYTGSNLLPDTVGNVFAARAASIGVDDLTNYPTSSSPNTDDLDPSTMVAIDTNALGYAWDGSAWDRLTRSADGLEVDVVNEPSVNLQDGAGNDIGSTSNALDVHINSIEAGVKFDVNLEDLVADDAAHSGEGLPIGLRCEDGLLTAVSADQDFGLSTGDMYRRQFVNASPNIGITLSKPTISDSEAEIASTPQAGRTRILVQNLSTKDIYVGPTGVLTTTGIRVAKGALLELPWGEDIDLYAISAVGISSDVRVLELA